MAVVWGASTAPSGKQARGQRQSRGLTSNRHAGARAGDSPGVCRFRSDPTICVAPDWIPIDQRTSRHPGLVPGRSEEHTSELQSLMRISYAVFCLKKKQTQLTSNYTPITNKPHIRCITISKDSK